MSGLARLREERTETERELFDPLIPIRHTLVARGDFKVELLSKFFGVLLHSQSAPAQRV